METRRYRIGSLVLVAALWLLSTPSSAAIVVDPGPVGVGFVENEFDLTAADLTGDTFDIVWADMKHVELFADEFYTIGLFG